MSLFTRLFRVGNKTNGKSKPKAKARATRRIPLFLEPLEDRMLLATRFVVPFEIAADNSTTFHTLSAALPGAAANDIIQIEPGSKPGNVADANLPNVQNLTIQGNPSVTAAETPVFFFTNAVSIDAAQAGFTLNRVNFIIQGGTLTFNANATIANSLVTHNSAGRAINLAGATSSVISNNYLVSSSLTANDIIQLNPSSSSNNLIIGNTIVSDTGVNTTLLSYVGGNNSTTDRILNNTLIGGVGFTAASLVGIFQANGLLFDGNTLTDPDSGQSGIVVNISQNVTVSDNVITLPGGTGLEILGNVGFTFTNVTVANNQFNTSGTGVGIVVTPGTSGTSTARIEGNDFHSNAIGVLIQAGSGATVSGIDLGGGGLGSLGGNNFRGFSSASSTTGAIVNLAATFQGIIIARSNIFSVADPETAIFDSADLGTKGNVDPAPFLTGNTAFVQTLYNEFLKRTGTAAELAFKVNQLATGTPVSTLVNSVVKSTEGLGHVVNDLFRRFLNRDADAGGKAFFIGQIQGGQTIESIICSLVASAEYRLTFGSDAAFVFSLYTKLLGRAGDNGGVAFWSGQVALIGRANVAKAFLNSAEYRGIVVTRLYQRLFNRTPGGAELSFWVGTGQTELALTVQYASSTEFRNNG